MLLKNTVINSVPKHLNHVRLMNGNAQMASALIRRSDVMECPIMEPAHGQLIVSINLTRMLRSAVQNLANIPGGGQVRVNARDYLLFDIFEKLKINKF